MPNAALKDGLSQIMPAAKPTRPFDDPAQQAAGLLLRLGIAIIAIGAPLGSVFSRRLIFSLVPVGVVLILLAILLDPQRRQMERLREVLAAPAAGALFQIGNYIASGCRGSRCPAVPYENIKSLSLAGGFGCLRPCCAGVRPAPIANAGAGD